MDNEKIEVPVIENSLVIDADLLPTPATQDEKSDEIKALELRVELSKRYVEPHTKVSRQVTEEDLKRVQEEGEIMWQLCYLGRGVYPSANAVAHPQIDDQDPLAFFMTLDGKFIINPVITKHSSYTVDKREGCLSYPEEPEIMVKRWHKCEVDFQTLSWEGEGEDKKIILSKVIHDIFSGFEANIWQHEIDHLNAKYIYPLKEKKND
jgi:peptide deformylase